MEPVYDTMKPKHAYFSISGAPMGYAFVFIEQAEAQGWEFVQLVFDSHAQIQNNSIAVPGQPNNQVVALYNVVIRKRITGDKRPDNPEFVDPALILRERSGGDGRQPEIQ